MNWLAHTVLAGSDLDLQLGGVLADLVKPPATHAFSPAVQRGIALHLAIDSFAHAHPAVNASIRRICEGGVGLRPAAAAIAVDMLHDHLLARDWATRGVVGRTLVAFTASFYAAAAEFTTPLPPRARLVLAAMSAQDWLGSYRSVDNVRLALHGIRRRLSPSAAAVSPLADAVDVFQHDPASFEEDFARFWPAVTEHARTFLATQPAPVNPPASPHL